MKKCCFAVTVTDIVLCSCCFCFAFSYLLEQRAYQIAIKLRHAVFFLCHGYLLQTFVKQEHSAG